MILENYRCYSVNQAGVNYAGASYSRDFNPARAGYSYGNTTSANIFVDVGFGDTTPVAKDNYTLDDSNLWGSNNYLTHVTGAVTHISPSITTVTSVYRNDTENVVTVKEVGIAYHYTNTAATTALLTRDIFPTPVIMQPGEVRAFTCSIDMIYPSSE